MKRLLLTLTLSLAAASLGGCFGSAQVRGGAHVTATPTLVAIGPGIWVVEDHHEPVFWSSGYYWYHDHGVWYRSHSHAGSWVRVRARAVPRSVVRIERPRAYVRYHGRAGARIKYGAHGKVIRRDHREPKRTKVKTRDHREPKRTKTRTRDHRDSDRVKTRDHRKRD